MTDKRVNEWTNIYNKHPMKIDRIDLNKGVIIRFRGFANNKKVSENIIYADNTNIYGEFAGSPWKEIETTRASTTAGWYIENKGTFLWDRTEIDGKINDSIIWVERLHVMHNDNLGYYLYAK